MRFLRSLSLRRQILSLTILLLVPFVIAGFWLWNRTSDEQDQQLRDEAGSVAATAGAYLTQYLSGIDSLASALVLHPAVVSLQRDEAGRLFSEVLKHQPLLLNIVCTDRTGVIRGTGIEARTTIGGTITLPYIADVVASGKPVVSELLIGAVTGKPTIIMGYPIVDGPTLVGVLGIGLDVAHLQSLFNGVPLPGGTGSVITLTDAKSRVLARSRDADRYIGKYSEPHPVLPRDVPRTQVLTGLDGVKRFYGSAVIDRGPWLLSVGIPTSVASERLMPLRVRNAVLIIMLMAGYLLVALSLSHLFSNNLDRLREGMQRIAAGDLSTPVRHSMPNLELSELQNSFVTMAGNLRDAHNALDRQIEQERKVRETLQSLQRQIVRQERLAAVGVLVSGVAHELNNPLQAILGTVELLERDPTLTLPKTVLDEIAVIKTQSGRAREIIRNLSRFSSQQSGPPAIINLRDVITEVVQLRRRNLHDSGIELEIDATTERRVYANFTEIEQVMLNFVINAQQAIESTDRAKGRILIRLFDTAKRVRLEVQDDGPGVTAHDESKLFQPFFTTKPVGKGTGLGLSVSYGIIDSYGGTIGHRLNDWGGATFFFELPAADNNDQTAVLQRPVPPLV
ncbi:MAG TPA: ATP-binding protein [Vicinamibacterales bacterium]|nr:ATP-binding protein [Vicinamibacterales bacterium]